MANVDKRLDKHWKATRKSKSNPDYLSHAHLLDSDESEKAKRDVYREPILRISAVSIGLVKSKESPDGDEMTFLHFDGQSKKLGLNSTNSETMENLAGSGVPRRWVGLTIQLYVDPKAKYLGGKKGPAIRIKPMIPRGPATPMPDTKAEDVERLEADRDEKIDGDERQPGEEG